MLGCEASRWNRNRTNFYSSFICTAFPASDQSDCWTSGIPFHQEKDIFLWHSRHQHHIVNQTLLVALVTIILLAILNFVCNDIPSFTAFFSFLRHLGPISRRRSLLVFVSRVRDQRLASRVELLVEGTHRWFPWKSSTFTWLEIFMLLLPQTTCLVSYMTDHLTDQEQPYTYVHTYIHTYIRTYTHTVKLFFSHVFNFREWGELRKLNPSKFGIGKIFDTSNYCTGYNFDSVAMWPVLDTPAWRYSSMIDLFWLSHKKLSYYIYEKGNTQFSPEFLQVVVLYA